MCGFIATKNIKCDLNEVLTTISYRGLPGYQGYYTEKDIQMAHIALPFVDKNPRNSVQPRYYNNRPALFVGEIFNYKDFGNYQTDGDLITEKFYSEGVDSFHGFDGFWSFVGVIENHLFVVNDYLSQKPVYYRTDCEAFASEIDVLKLLGQTSIDEEYMKCVLDNGYDSSGRTPWKEIRQMPAGHYMHKGKLTKYWDWSKITTTNSLYEDLEQSVRLRLKGQQKMAMLVSGGLDSSIIYQLAKKYMTNIDVIHIENNEWEYARLIAPDAHRITFDSVSYSDALHIHQCPVDLGSVKAQIAMSKKLKELGYNGVLTGDGADELFGGYQRALTKDTQYTDVFKELPYYHLPRLDRCSMYSTIEVRSPFLSPRVIAHALTTPYKRRAGIKQRLIDTFKDLLPGEIINRKKVPLKTADIKNDPMSVRIEMDKLWRKLNERV